MNYREEREKSKRYKVQYLVGIDKLISERQAEAERIRNGYIKDIFASGEKYRNDFKRMLGWPLVDYTPDGLPGVEAEKLSDENGYSVYRVQFEIFDGLKMTGLFFKMDGEEKKPLVIVQHGGWGTPELISGVYGNTSNYNDMLQRVIKYGVHAFAPQLLLWHDDYNVPFDRKAIDARLKRVGSSITALEIFGLQRILDYFENQDYVSTFGMVGLSYGGFYTLFTTAIDERIKSAVSCSFFNKRDEVPWSDWTWFKSAEMFDDAEIACLVYPRKLYLEIGTKDELFNVECGIESFEKLKKMCGSCGDEWVSLTVFEGTHEFCMDDAPIESLIKDLNVKGL